MNLSLSLVADGNTTPRELAAVADALEEALRAERAISDVRRAETTAAPGAKGIAQAIGSFLVSLPPTAITGAFGVLSTVLARAAETPTKVKVAADGGVEVEFDPRHTTPEQMVALVQGLRPAKPTG